MLFSMIKLFDYQQEQVNEYLKNGKNINLSEVGTGKTFVGLESFKQSKYTKLLVICLAPKVKDFTSDGGKVGLEITPLNKGTKKNKLLLNEAENIAISFESSWRLIELLKWVDKDTFILIDESHKVKSRSSKVTKFAEKLSKKAGSVYLMTATPIGNGKYEEWFEQLKIAKVLTKDTWKAFKEQYLITEYQDLYVGGMRREIEQIVGYKNLEQLDESLNNRAVFKKRDIHDSLIPEDVFYYVSKPTMYNKLRKERVVVYNDVKTEFDTTSKMYHALKQLSSGVLKEVDKPLKKEKLDYLELVLNENENNRVTVFYNYTSELNAIIQLMDKLKRPYSMYNGNSHDLTAFNNNEDGVALVQYKSGSTGVNDFVISHICVFYSMPDGSTTYIQAKGRLNRTGQTSKPLFYHLICKGSVEEKVYSMIEQGVDITDDIMQKLI